MKNVSLANNFNLAPAQVEIQKLAAEFAARELKPEAAKFDRDAAASADILKRMLAAGLVNVCLPEAFGGLGLSRFEACLIAEELASGCCAVASFEEASEIAITPIVRFASQVQKESLLIPLADEQAFAGFALSFFEAATAPLKAVRQADQFILSGTMDRVANGCSAKWILVEAEIVEGAWAAFCLPRDSTSIKINPCAAGLGRRASDIASIECQNVKIAGEFQINPGCKRSEFVSELRDYSFPLIASGCVGLGKAALAHAVTYAGQRQTFGQPIARHQGLSFMLADMAKSVEASRLLAWRAAKACDEGVGSHVLSGAAKAYAQEAVMAITTDAVQIFGGYGYSKEYPVEKLMRDAKEYQLFGGVAEASKGELGRNLLTACSD